MKKLSQSTIEKYTVKQIALHADRYQDAFECCLYRFDFSFNSVYKYESGNYFYYMALYNLNDNKEMILNALREIYAAGDIK